MVRYLNILTGGNPNDADVFDRPFLTNYFIVQRQNKNKKVKSRTTAVHSYLFITIALLICFYILINNYN